MQKLMFIIDEGIGGNELLSLYGDDTEKLDASLDNIYEGLKPLQEKYQVVLLVYPTYHYRESGYGGDPADPLNRISPQLKHLFAYFADKNMPVYLEIHSSGIYTNQNGELGNMPLVPLHYGQAERYKSLPMDMEAVAALKQEYGAAFEGLRFHELVGTHEIALYDAARGREEQSHAFLVHDEVMRGIIDTVAETGLQLVWGDHSFNLVAEQPQKFACFRTWLDYAVERLGKQQLTLNWANNGWPMHKYITGEFAFRNYRGVNTGMSVQSWFWQESDSSTMTTCRDGKWDVKWYAYAEMECPAELMAMYTLKYLREGCTLVQYEPSHYLFNFYRPGRTLTAYRGNVEQKPDYSLRTIGKRLVHMLLNGVAFDIEPSRYYDADRDKFVYNRVGEGAKRYYQNTLGVVYDDGNSRCFDVYNNDYSRILEDSLYRYPQGIFTGAMQVSRVHMGYSGIDDIFTLTESGELTMYNLRGGITYHDKSTFAPQAGETLVGMVALNLAPAYVNCLDGEADELLAVYNKGGKPIARAYQAIGEGSPLERDFVFRPLVTKVELPVTACDGLVGIFGVRTQNCINSDATRPRETALAAVTALPQGFTVSVSADGKQKHYDFPQAGRAIAATTVDFDGDLADEVAVCVQSGDGYVVRFVHLQTGTLGERTISLGAQKPKLLFSQRIGYNQKNFEPVFGNLNNGLIGED